MRFRRAKSTEGNTKCQKNYFEDDQVPGHHPRALRQIYISSVCLFVLYRPWFPGAALRDRRQSGVQAGQSRLTPAPQIAGVWELNEAWTLAEEESR